MQVQAKCWPGCACRSRPSRIAGSSTRPRPPPSLPAGPRTTMGVQDRNTNMLFANFNQDFTYAPTCEPRTLSPLTRNRCVSVGTRKGYSITNCDPFGRVYTMSLCCPVPQLAIADCAPDDGARGIVEMLFCTSLIALVGAADQPQSSPRKLQIVNTKVASLLHAFQSLRLTHRPPATIHDLRAALSVLHPCSQTEPQNARHRAGGRNLHLRHIQHALTPCHRNVAEPRWCV